MGISMTQLIIVLVIIILIFGTKKLSNIGSDLGGAFKGFKSAINEKDEIATDDEKNDGRIIEGMAEHEHESTTVGEKEKE